MRGTSEEALLKGVLVRTRASRDAMETRQSNCLEVKLGHDFQEAVFARA